MDMNPYLTFNGQCFEALSFYAEVFDGEVFDVMYFRDLPGADPFPKGIGNRVMHMKMRLGGKLIMASDSQGTDAPRPEGFQLQVGFDKLEDAKKAFGALAEGGEIGMPFEPTFFAAGFGKCRDRFGIEWMINCDQSA